VLDPVSVALKFGFLVVLYLFLVWVVRSAGKDLRRAPGAASLRPSAATPPVLSAPEATSMHVATSPSGEPRLVVERAPGHTPGMEYDVGPGAVMGRGDQAEIRLEDPFASSQHARLSREGGVVVLEDLGSTNGTYLNEELLGGPMPLHEGDRVRIGDSEFTFQES
jgi:FHA domain